MQDFGFAPFPFQPTRALPLLRDTAVFLQKSQLFGSAVSARQKPLEGIGKPEERLPHFSPAAKEVLRAESDKKAWIQPCTLSFVFAPRQRR